MLSGLDREDNVIKNMAREIVRDCGLSGAAISFDVAIYLVHLKFLIPTNRVTDDKVLIRNMAQPVVEECVHDFLEDAVWINTIKLQSYSENNLVDRVKVRNEYREIVWKKAKPVMKEIVEMDPADKDDRDKLYKKFILFSILFSGLGNPSINSVFKEANAALQSVFKYNEFERFITLSDAEKEQELLEFSRIINGIRLFNKDCQKGGDSIDDLPLILAQASQITQERLVATLESLMRRIQQLTSALEKVYSHCEHRVRKLDVHLKLPPDFTIADVDKLKRILFMAKEQEYYMKKLLVINGESMSSITNLIERFRETLSQLHELVRYRSAIPTVQVYPLFIILSHLWEAMQEEAAVLGDTNEFMVKLYSFNKFPEQTQLEVILSAEEPLKEPKPDTLATSIDPERLQSGVRLLDGVEDDQPREFEFGGYCAWTLAAMEGLLIPGNSKIGFLQYKNKLYAFSSIFIAEKWGKHPDRYIRDVYKLARAKLELVKILDLYDDLYELKTVSLVDVTGKQVTQSNVQIQTEVHPIKSFIDRNYSFSFWELKRKALQLSHVINYETKSQQTIDHSHFRSSVGIQMKPPKSEETQTKRDNSCNHPTLSSYLNGLRGHYDDKFRALDLTRPIDEDALPKNIIQEKN